MLRVILFLLSVSLLIGCFSKSEYEKTLEKEIASGIRYDSLFFNIKLGQSKKQFFDNCRDLNRKGILFEGSIEGKQAVEYKLSQLKYPAEMNFYPKFYKDQLCDMQVTFKYDAWAPWNKELQSETLQEEVIRLLEKWYGEGFIKITSRHEKWPAYVKVNGNRRISVFRSDDMFVKVFFTDLLIEKELKASIEMTK